MTEKTCFVIMGFGVKTDHKTGRTLDLDKTYVNIIKPVMLELGYVCFRADEIKHSGVIDVEMYENIIKADFVIADLSTLNPNVFYELGIRHAVKKYTTIIIAENELTYPFDINHVSIESYEHLGKDIGISEGERFRKVLREKVLELENNPKTDSPLYTFFQNLEAPKFTEAEIIEIKEDVEEQISISDIIAEAEKAKDNSDFIKAKGLFEQALGFYNHNEFLIQRLALCTYKSEFPDRAKALFEAELILEKLNPDRTTDPETLGLSGAVNKRLYEIYNDKKFLERAIWFYYRGFSIKQDYYNGINLAFMYNLKAIIEENSFEAYASFGNAISLRKKTIEICESLIKDDRFHEREDKAWIFQTLAEGYLGLEDEKNEEYYLQEAQKVQNKFNRESYREQNKLLVDSIKIFKNKFK